VHEVVAESLLEFGCHEVVTRTRSSQDGEMDLEPEEIEEEGNDDETQSTCSEVLSKGEEIQGTAFALDVKEIPEVDQNGTSNGEERECSNVLGGDDTAHAEASQQQPLPPFASEWIMSLLVELDIGEDTEGHEEDEGGVEQDESCLANMRVVK